MLNATKKILIIRQMPGRTVIEMAGYCRDAFKELSLDVSILDYRERRLSSRIPFLHAPERKFAEAGLMRAARAFGPDLIVVIKGTEVPIETVESFERPVFASPVTG